MNTYSFRRFVSFLNLAWLCLMIASGSSWAQSSPTTIYYNHETPQLQFAASEIRAAVAAKTGRLVERALSEFNSQSDGTAFVIAAGANDSRV
jgi:hypothetical protein